MKIVRMLLFNCMQHDSQAGESLVAQQTPYHSLAFLLLCHRGRDYQARSSATLLLRPDLSSSVILTYPMLCDYTLAIQQRTISLIPEQGSLLGVIGIAIRKTEVYIVPLPSSREEDVTKIFPVS